MAIEKLKSGGFCFTGKESTGLYRLMVLKGRLKMELMGLKFRQSTYALIKREFGFRGNRQKVYDQFVDYVEKKKAEHG